MRIHPIIRRRPARMALALLLAAGCAGSTQPEIGGEYLAVLDSPFNAEGAALLELTSPDLRAVSAPGRVLVARGTTERTLRILVINRPNSQAGGPVSFRVRMADGAPPPEVAVLAVSGPLNDARDFVGGYAVYFSRLDPSASSASLAAGGAGLEREPEPQLTPPIPFARLVAPLFPGGLPLTIPEIQIADRVGNSNNAYDLGDVRGYLGIYTAAIPPERPWTR